MLISVFSFQSLCLCNVEATAPFKPAFGQLNHPIKWSTNLKINELSVWYLESKYTVYKQHILGFIGLSIAGDT